MQSRMLLIQTVEKLDALESRISLVNSSSLENSKSAGQTVEMAVEGVMHLLERLLVSLQCLAADARTISNAAAAAKVETLVSILMKGLEAQAVNAAGGPGKQLSSAAALTVLRNAAGTTNKQRVLELEQQVYLLQLQFSDSSSQLTAAASAAARLQRTLQLKLRAVGSLERQVASLESELHHFKASQGHNDSTITQLQQELASVKLDYAQACAAATGQAGELQAAVERAAAAESESQRLQQSATEAAAACDKLAEQMQTAVAAGRQDALEAKKASSIAAAATLQAEQLQAQLAAAIERSSQLERELKDSRQRADISVQSARDAEYRAVQTTTLLADARRALEYTQQLLQDATSKDAQTS